MNASRILVLDDEKNIGIVLQAILEREGYEVLLYQDAELALSFLNESSDDEDLDAVLTDLYMPGKTGMEILEHCHARFPKLPVLMMTAFGSIETAVLALKKGAFDFITKPFDQADLLQTVAKAVATSQERKKEPSAVHVQSPDTQAWIKKVAQTHVPILIRGESGTGKEWVAQAIHSQSSRAQNPFLTFNCSVVAPDALSQELFGSDLGKPGRFQLAHRGSLFLEEISSMNEKTQAELMNYLDDPSLDVRLIVGTSHELHFRQDLYYRLTVASFELPPLRHRPEDVEAWSKSWLQPLNKKFNKNVRTLDADCLNSLKSYRWPGNARELETVLERMVLLSEADFLSVQDLPEEIRPIQSQNLNFKEQVRLKTIQVEYDLIEKALKDTHWNITHAAERLGLSRKGLQLKIKELAMKRPG